MTAAVLVLNEFDLPWNTDTPDTRRFRRLLVTFVVLVSLAGIVVPWLPLPEIERQELEELPPHLARILLDKPEVVIPPPPPPAEVKKDEPKPEEKKPEPPKEIEKVVEPPPTVADAREKASISGLLAFQDSFADMRDAVDTSKLQDTAAIQRGSGEAATIDRSILTSKQGRRSAGVNVSALSRDTGGVALSGRETTKVDAPKGAKGGGGNRARVASDAHQRSIEEIRRVFDSNKGAIFAIYNRALRKDPSLQGQVVLELKIDPSGRVLECNVVSSELVDESVVAKIVNRIRLFDFGEREVSTTTLRYPVTFLPT